jgi:hypothetical protein
MALKYTESKQESRIPLVLIHAFPLNRNFWQYQIEGNEFLFGN